MNSIEWFYNEIKHIIPNDFLHKYVEAKEIEKQEHSKTWDSAIEQFCKRGGNLSRASCDFDDYFDETYGSKGSGNTPKCTCNVDSFLCQIHGTSDGKTITAF